jgi:hypothetical protein
MKPWHMLMAWVLARKIRHQHRELAKYIRRSAYEITAWKQDIGFLDEQLRHHLLSSNSSGVTESADDLSIDLGTLPDSDKDDVTRALRQESTPPSHRRVDGSD